MFEKLLKKEASPEKEAKKEEFLFKVELQHEIPALPDFKTKEVFTTFANRSLSR